MFVCDMRVYGSGERMPSTSVPAARRNDIDRA
jgi:hypothetical protein